MVTHAHLGAYHAPMNQATSALPPESPQPAEPSTTSEWLALWTLEGVQPARVHNSVALLDGAIQGEMGHS